MSPAPAARPATMLIIAGHLEVDPAVRDAYVDGCVAVVEAARTAPGCFAFSVTADSVDPGRVCIYERWEDEPQLLAFRNAGPSEGQQAEILGADVKRYAISAVGDS